MNAKVRLVWGAMLGVVLCLAARPALAGDPHLEWYTIRTPRFRVHYHGGLGALAQRVATLAESINARLSPELGFEPSEATHILLTDGTDDANGEATGLPYNAIRLFVTAPDDMSPLGDYDDWLVELLTHEHTHILHVDNVRGIPALVNAIIGKTLLPNQNQPRWILEGLAVTMESAQTTGGRVRGTLFDMFLRADVLENNFAGLDEITHEVRRWPRSNLWYLYGGKFIAWIRDIYGPDTFRAVALDYAQNPVAWGINRSIRRATGRTYEELYAAWQKALLRKYRAQAAAVMERGLREGVRITAHGGGTANPRFVPQPCRSSAESEVLYHRDDGHTIDGLYRFALTTPNGRRSDPILVARTAGVDRAASFAPDCGIVFDSVAPSRRRHSFSDLHRMPPAGHPGSRERWTTGQRARDPDVSPDGRLVVFVTNHAGTSTLRIAKIRPEGGIEGDRPLVPSARYEQAYTPRFSPDGRHVAYSVWTRGGYRHIRVVDVSTGSFVQVTRDRALDQQPSWFPDGKRLLFTSDRTGIANVYAIDLETGGLLQVTNTINGAYMPEISGDGATLLYVGYTHEGFDLFAMPLDPARFLDAPPPPRDRPEAVEDPPLERWPVYPYNPLPTLRPRALDFEYGPGTFGQALTVTVSGRDILSYHSLTASITYQTELDELTGSVSYNYSRLPFDLNVGAFRDVVPRQSVVINDQARRVDEELKGVSTGVGYRIPGEFDAQNVNFSYTITDRDPKVPLGETLDPFSRAPDNPFEGILASVGLGYAYDSSYRSAWAISTERGFSFSVSSEIASRETASEETLQSFRGRVTGYVLMPWARHHVFATSLGAGAAAGTFPARGFFFTGGFAEEDTVDAFQTGVRQGGFVLRGYAPGRFVGRKFDLLNLEYRFPILYADRGISTLPAFLRGVSGLLFTDIGGAFDRIDSEHPFAEQHVGIGGEIWISVLLGYYLSGTFRLGWAKGLDEDAVPGSQTYFVLASSF